MPASTTMPTRTDISVFIVMLLGCIRGRDTCRPSHVGFLPSSVLVGFAPAGANLRQTSAFMSNAYGQNGSYSWAGIMTAPNSTRERGNRGTVDDAFACDLGAADQVGDTHDHLLCHSRCAFPHVRTIHTAKPIRMTISATAISVRAINSMARRSIVMACIPIAHSP